MITFPIAVIVHFSMNCVIITGFFFVGISNKSVKWCEEDSLSSSFAFLSTWNESGLLDRLDAERTTPVKKIFLQVVRNQNVRHQLRVNRYSTRVSLNCSESSQYSIRQCPPCRVPMKRCVRLSFILIVMTQRSWNHFGDRFWQSSSMRWIGRNDFPLPLGRRNRSLCERARLAGKHAESVRTNLLDAGLTCNMDHTSLLDASLRLCQARFSSFCFLEFREWFCTGSEFGIENMNFIHEPTPSSGYQNIGCPCWIIWWWNCNFKSIFFWRIFTIWTSMTGPIIGPPGIAAKTRIVGLLGKVYFLCIMDWSAQNRRPRHVWFCSSYQLKPSARTMRLRKPLWIELFRTVIRSPECFPQAVSRCLSWRRYHKFCFLWFHTCQYTFGHGFLYLCLLSSRIVLTNSKLLRLKHPFWSVWCLCYSDAGWPVSLNRCTMWVAESPIFLQLFQEEFHTTSFRLQDWRTSTVPEGISSRMPWLFLNSKYKIPSFPFFVQSMSFNIDMKMILGPDRFWPAAILTAFGPDRFPRLAQNDPSKAQTHNVGGPWPPPGATILRVDLLREKNKRENGAGEGKNAKFWALHPSGHHPSEIPAFGPHSSDRSGRGKEEGRVYGVSVILLFQDSTTQSTDTLWIVPPFYWLQRVPFSFKCSIPPLFVTKTEERPVSLRESLRVFLDFSEFEIRIPSFPFLVQSMSLNIDMKMIRSVNFSQIQCFVLANHSRFSEESAMKKILGEYSTRIQLFLHRFPAILCKKRTFWILPLDLPNSQLHLCYHTSSPDTVRNLRNRVLLLLATGSLDLETMSISSMREMNFQAVSLWDFLQNVPISTYEWY